MLFAQALLPPPALLVLDEPMTSMDEVGADRFAALIRELAAEGVTVLWIAHDLAQVRAMADAVTCVNRTVLFSGEPAACSPTSTRRCSSIKLRRRRCVAVAS